MKWGPVVGCLPEVTPEVKGMAQTENSWAPTWGEENLGHNGAPFSSDFL